jgi:hypothetical protein
MKRFITLTFLFLILSLNAQTPKEKKQILEHSNIDKLNVLKDNIIQKNILNTKIIDDYVRKNGITKQVLENGNFKEIKYIQNNKPIYVTVDNVNAATSTRTDKLHNGGGLNLNLEGQNMHIAIWDGGSVLLTHQEFLNSDSSGYRVSKGETLLTTVSNHATHVAGTMVAKGTDPRAKGMAPQATLTSYDWSNDSVEVIDEITQNALLLSNHSYGIPGFDSNGDISVQPWVLGCYSSDAALWDQIAYNAPYYLMVASAGNNGDVNDNSDQLQAGYDKLTHEKNAKNNLVVASAKPLVFPNGNILIQEDSFSSQGPSDDGRIKPDITANGNLSYSSYSTTDDAYANSGGTSMSSPNTSGTLLLLQQYYNQLNSKFMKAATLKGLSCHTAKDDNFKIGPDPELGWGFLNAEVAVNTILDDFNGNALILEANLSDGESYSTTFSTDGTSELSASICWTDPAGSSKNNLLNDSTPVLVNDLDLRITAPDGNTIFFPWKLQLSNISAAAITGDNTVDTVENIDITVPLAGTYTLDVTHKGTLMNGNQDFSLIITGSNIVLNKSGNNFLDYSVWPNPTSDFLNFNFKSKSNDNIYISLIDTIGRKMMTRVIANSKYEINSSIRVDYLNKGIYILNIKQGNSTINKKIIIN